jgi:hypothetical protein
MNQNARLIFPNSATDPVVHAWAEKTLPDLCRQARTQRKTKEERWLHFWKLWSVELDQPSYEGRSQVYLASARRALETWQVALHEALFPRTDWFRVLPVKDISDPAQVARWAALQHVYLREMALEDEFPLFLRQFLTYGTGILRHTWAYEEERQRTWERQMADAPPPAADDDDEARIIDEEEEPAEAYTLEQAGTVWRLVERMVATKSGPSVRAVDLFHFFVVPHTARSIPEATAAFEDMQVPFRHVLERHEQWMDPDREDWGRLYDHPDWERIVEAGGFLSDELRSAYADRFSRDGFDPDPNSAYTALSKKGETQLTELFWRGTIPDARDETGKLFGQRDWHFVLLNNLWCVRAHPNLHYKNDRPWLDARMYRTVGSYYAQGVCDVIASINLMLNDIGNLTIDNLNMALSPPMAFDETKVMVPEAYEFAPGAQWFFDGPPQDSVQMLQIPTQAQLGMGMMSMMMGFSHDYSGANAATQGVPPARGQGRVAQSAAGMSMLQAQGSAEMLSFARVIQRGLLEELLARNYRFTEQFGCAPTTIRRLGADGQQLLVEEVSLEDILGGYQYEWRGASAMQERAMLMGTLQQFPQMVAQLAQVDPRLVHMFDAVAFLRLMLTDGVNAPWADEIFKLPGDGVSVSPSLEHQSMAMHRRVMPHPADHDAGHLMAHVAALQQDERFLTDPIARQLLMEHAEMTQAQMQQKMMAQQQAMMAAQQGPPQGPPGQQGSMPGPPGPQGPQPAPPPMAPNGQDMMADQARQTAGGMQ